MTVKHNSADEDYVIQLKALEKKIELGLFCGFYSFRFRRSVTQLNSIFVQLFLREQQV